MIHENDKHIYIEEISQKVSFMLSLSPVGSQNSSHMEIL